MKTVNFKQYVMALMAGMSVLTACSDDDNGNGGNGDSGNNVVENGATLKGIITEDVTLKAGNSYKLSGEYIVAEGVTLSSEKDIYNNDAFLTAGNTVDTSLSYTDFAAAKAACNWIIGSWVK